jgi:transcriptional regulator with XRE-family HTH domain
MRPMKKTRAHHPATLDALTAFGLQIASARREIGWTAEDLAERLGTSRQLVSRLEHGNPGVTIGIMFDAAVICCVPLFGTSSHGMSDVAAIQAARYALLPQRVRKTEVVDDDF